MVCGVFTSMGEGYKSNFSFDLLLSVLVDWLEESNDSQNKLKLCPREPYWCLNLLNNTTIKTCSVNQQWTKIFKAHGMYTSFYNQQMFQIHKARQVVASSPDYPEINTILPVKNKTLLY